MRAVLIPLLAGLFSNTNRDSKASCGFVLIPLLAGLFSNGTPDQCLAYARVLIPLLAGLFSNKQGVPDEVVVLGLNPLIGGAVFE